MLVAVLAAAVHGRVLGVSTLPGAPGAKVLPRIVIIGGTGRIGTAVAEHLLARAEPAQIMLAGRDRARGEAAVAEVRRQRMGMFSLSRVEYLEVDWRDSGSLAASLNGAAAVVHTAGPYAGETPDVLAAAIAAAVPVYVDLSDPVPYLRSALELDGSAQSSGTLALCAAGAFPGLSNVLAMECAGRLGDPVQDLAFSYFTAGLGGSGEINLYITNEGFGEEVPIFRSGEYAPQLDAGSGARKVSFFLDADDASDGTTSRSLVGERTVWNWPFPEGCTVAEALRIRGDSSVGMGTAYAIAAWLHLFAPTSSAAALPLSPRPTPIRSPHHLTHTIGLSSGTPSWARWSLWCRGAGGRCLLSLSLTPTTLTSTLPPHPDPDKHRQPAVLRLKP